MRSASLLPSTPAGLRGSERSTVLFLVGLFGGCLGARLFVSGCAVRPVVAVSFGPGRPGGAGRCGAGAFPNFFF